MIQWGVFLIAYQVMGHLHPRSALHMLTVNAMSYSYNSEHFKLDKIVRIGIKRSLQAPSPSQEKWLLTNINEGRKQA